MKKKFFVTLAASALCLTLSLSVYAASALPFSDVKETSWYYSNLVKLYNENVINGFEDGTFKGTQTLKYDQLIKLIITTINPYGDYTKGVIGGWAEPYIKVAQDFKILEEPKLIEKKVDGASYYERETIDTSKYAVDIKRADVAKLVADAYNCGAKYETPAMRQATHEEAKTILKENYKDYSSIKDDYIEAIYELYLLGIMQGDDKGKFNPNGYLTRAEATAIIFRLMDARTEAISNNYIDYTELESYGYKYSKNKAAESSAHNPEKGGIGVGSSNTPSFETLDLTIAEIEEIYKSEEKVIEVFGYDALVGTAEDVQKFKDLMLSMAKDAVR